MAKKRKRKGAEPAAPQTPEAREVARSAPPLRIVAPVVEPAAPVVVPVVTPAAPVAAPVVEPAAAPSAAPAAAAIAVKIAAPILDEARPALPPSAAVAPAAAPSAPPVSSPGPGGKSIAPQPPALDRALRAYEQGACLEALALFERAVADEPDNHKARSYWGLLLVLERGQQKRGLEALEEARQGAPDDAEVVLNLAAALTRMEQKGRAIDVLRAGLQLVPDHEGMRDQLTKLGVRRNPPIKSLPRSHPLNKWVGIALYRWLGIGRSS